jgi:hypothetical protein
MISIYMKIPKRQVPSVKYSLFYFTCYNFAQTIQNDLRTNNSIPFIELEGKAHLGRPSCRWRIFKWSLKVSGPNSPGLGWVQTATFCKHGIEFYDPKKGGWILNEMDDCYILKKDYVLWRWLNSDPHAE